MRSQRTILTLLSATLLLLTACGTAPAGGGLELQSSAPIQLDSDTPQADLVIENTGGSDVNWSAHSSNDRVSVAPAHGTLAPGGVDQIAIAGDESGLSKGDSFDADVTFTSNDGNAKVAVHYDVTTAPAPGTIQCGVFTSPKTATASAADTSRDGVRRAAPSPGASAAPRAYDARGRAYVPGELLVALRAADRLSGAQAARGGAATAQAVRADHGLTLLRAGGPDAPDLVRVDDVPATLAALAADARVRYAQPNFYLTPLSTTHPNDTYYGDQWNLSLFGLPQAWAIEHGNSNRVVVAIVDSGVQPDHEDLAAKILPGCDLHDDDADASPDVNSVHGTHVAGIAAAIGDNGKGVAGVAYGPKVKILPVKVFDNAGADATVDDLVRGVRWAAGLDVPGVHANPNPAMVINMSVGIPGDQPAIDDVTQQAWDAGAILVAAAGNHTSGSADPGVMSPANAPAVMAVGSVDSDDTVSDFSNTGSDVEIAAPGGTLKTGSNICATVGPTSTIVSTYPYDSSTAGRYGCEAGTSMAAPFVAGVAALLASAHPGWSNQQIRDQLTATAYYDNSTMTHDEVGSGVACADAALGAATTCGAP